MLCVSSNVPSPQWKRGHLSMGYHHALPSYFRRCLHDDMAPTDRIRLPFRWQFVPVTDPRDGSVRWTWRAYTQSGSLAIESENLLRYAE
ncbi:MAG: hypothetical protein QOK44_1025 [Betaproteobacteria bacterium]|jgi:hypothetical protein|nr:hypothetical protein [Betaproteobacteria bacterium]